MLKGRALLAYVAGIIDGEGTICISRRKKGNKIWNHTLFVQVSNTQEWLIEFLKLQFGGNTDYRKAHDNARESWRWTAHTREASSFLRLILPYLQLKRPQAELAIEFQKRRNPIGKHLTKEQRVLAEADAILMKSMNQRVSPLESGRD